MWQFSKNSKAFLHFCFVFLILFRQWIDIACVADYLIVRMGLALAESDRPGAGKRIIPANGVPRTSGNAMWSIIRRILERARKRHKEREKLAELRKKPLPGGAGGVSCWRRPASPPV